MQTFLLIPLTTLLMTAPATWTENQNVNTSVYHICLNQSPEVQHELVTDELNIKDIIVRVENIAGEEATMEELAQASKLVVTYPENFSAEKTVTVESYTLSYKQDDVWKDIHTTGADITPEMHAVLKSIKPTEKLYFERIMVKMPDGTSRKMASQAIRVI
jgi:hypothetical protein